MQFKSQNGPARLDILLKYLQTVYIKQPLTNKLYQTVTKRWPSHCVARGVLFEAILRPYATIECMCKVCTALGNCSFPHKSWL